MTILITTVAAGALAYLGICAIRWASRRHGRQTTTEVVSPALAAAARGVRLLLVRWAQRGAEPVHVGATEDWSPTGEMAAVVAQPSTAPAPDWDTQRWLREANAADHAALNALEDAAHADIEHIWGRFYDWLGVDAKTRLRLPSSVEDTGAIPRAELDAMLEGAQA